MNDDLGLIAGCLLIFLVCTWAVGHLAARVGGNIRAEIATDRTLSEVDKESAPALFWLQNHCLSVADWRIGIDRHRRRLSPSLCDWQASRKSRVQDSRRLLPRLIWPASQKLRGDRSCVWVADSAMALASRPFASVGGRVRPATSRNWEQILVADARLLGTSSGDWPKRRRGWPIADDRHWRGSSVPQCRAAGQHAIAPW